MPEEYPLVEWSPLNSLPEAKRRDEVDLGGPFIVTKGGESDDDQEDAEIRSADCLRHQDRMSNPRMRPRWVAIRAGEIGNPLLLLERFLDLSNFLAKCFETVEDSLFQRTARIAVGRSKKLSRVIEL
jgi:hypothetical protein